MPFHLACSGDCHTSNQIGRHRVARCDFAGFQVESFGHRSYSSWFLPFFLLRKIEPLKGTSPLRQTVDTKFLRATLKRFGWVHPIRPSRQSIDGMSVEYGSANYVDSRGLRANGRFQSTIACIFRLPAGGLDDRIAATSLSGNLCDMSSAIFGP